MNEPKTGAELIAAERQRQTTDEGYAPEHDDAHTRAELTDAAAAYIYAGDALQLDKAKDDPDPDAVARDLWPWDKAGFKPSPDPVRNYVKAGALIAAEIDRLLRLQAAQADGNHPRLLCAACDLWSNHSGTCHHILPELEG